MDTYFSWEFLTTISGCSLAVALITQFIKELPIIKRIPTQVVSWIIALIILIAASYFTDDLTIKNTVLIPFNAIITALSSNGMYSAVKKISNIKEDISNDK
mgnify:CR=1 FL=1